MKRNDQAPKPGADFNLRNLRSQCIHLVWPNVAVQHLNLRGTPDSARQIIRAIDRHLAPLDAKALRLQLLHERNERFVVGPFDGDDFSVRTPIGGVPDRLRRRGVPEIENQKKPIAHRHGNASRAEKVR